MEQHNRCVTRIRKPISLYVSSSVCFTTSPVLCTRLDFSLRFDDLSRPGRVIALRRSHRDYQRVPGRSLASSPDNTEKTAHPALSTSSPFSPLTSARWINALWFASLALSLSSALISMLAKQWVLAYSPKRIGTPRDRARHRQHLLNSVRTWRVGDIIEAMPVVLRTALLLSFAGRAIYVWTISRRCVFHFSSRIVHTTRPC